MSVKIKCSLGGRETCSFQALAFTLMMSLGLLGLGALAGCGGTSSEVMTIRLLDEFASANVEGESTDSVPSPPRTEWRFDGSASDANLQWKAGPGVAGLSVGDGFLKARSTTEIPILHVERTSGLENPDVLHSVEVRMRASEGANLAVMFSNSEELDLDAETNKGLCHLAANGARAENREAGRWLSEIKQRLVRQRFARSESWNRRDCSARAGRKHDTSSAQALLANLYGRVVNELSRT